jgi:protein SCO1/2
MRGGQYCGQFWSVFLRAFKPLAAGLCAVLALGLGIWTASKWYAPAPLLPIESGVLLPEPRPVAGFSLTDQDGRTFTHANLLNHWSLVFAGFTHCPDVCPTTLSLMKLLEQRLQADNRGLSMVFVSVDPERDTPQQLQKYVRYFSPNLTGATGPAEELERLCASLGIAYVKVPGATPGDYTIDHSAALVLLNPQGKVAGYFQAPYKLDTLAADLARIIPPST